MSSHTSKLNWIPPTTSKTVVFPWNSQRKIFEKDFYQPELTNDQVSIDEVNQFISEIEIEYKPCEQSWEEIAKICCSSLSIYGVFVLDAFIIGSNTMAELVSPLTRTEAIVLTWIIPLVLVTINKLCNPERIPNENSNSQMQWKCIDIVERYNETLKSRNLKWYLPQSFPTWIELTRDMEKTNNNDLEISDKDSIPATTAFTIVLPAQHSKRDKIIRFSQDFYSPDMVDGRISCQEMQEFLSELNASLRTRIEGSHTIRRSLLIWLCLEFFGLLCISNHLPDLLTTLEIIIIVVITVIISPLLILLELDREEQKIKVQMRAGCQKIIDQQNMALQNKGLRWHLPEQFPDWIELCKCEGEENKNFSHQEIEIPLYNQEHVTNQGYHKKFKNKMYAPIPEDENEEKKDL